MKVFSTFNLTLGEDTLTWTIIGANEVLMSCPGWLMVSASKTTSCRALASSKILSISLCTSAAGRRKHTAAQEWNGKRRRKNLSLVTTGTWETCTSLSKTLPVALPRLERVLDLSMMALLLGLFSTDLLANDMSAVTLVMDILKTPRPPKKNKTFHKIFRANWQWFTEGQMWPLTSRQTCALGSQTAPSASYLSPIKMASQRSLKDVTVDIWHGQLVLSN